MNDWNECVEVSINDGLIFVRCKLGLWAVEGSDYGAVMREAFGYFRQYKKDGEYSSIIGGPTVTEVLSRQPTTKLYKP